jgi:hypothetical protein
VVEIFLVLAVTSHLGTCVSFGNLFRVLFFVAHKLASELITENERKHCGTAGDIFGMVETETLILAPQAKILGI